MWVQPSWIAYGSIQWLGLGWGGRLLFRSYFVLLVAAQTLRLHVASRRHLSSARMPQWRARLWAAVYVAHADLIGSVRHPTKTGFEDHGKGSFGQLRLPEAIHDPETRLDMCELASLAIPGS